MNRLNAFPPSVLQKLRERGRLVNAVALISMLGTFIPRTAFAAPAATSNAAATSASDMKSGATDPSSPSLSVNDGSGGLSASFSFALPSARGAAQPSLSLSYSASGAIREAGRGWGLTIPTLQRSPLSGLPGTARPEPGKPLSPDLDPIAFGGEPLVPIGFVKETLVSEAPGETFPIGLHGALYYRQQRDSSHARFFWLTNDTWLVQWPNGVLSTYERRGLQDRWVILRSFDTQPGDGKDSNEVVYVWGQDEDFQYLYEIRDTRRGGGGSADNYAHRTVLQWETVSTPRRSKEHSRKVPTRRLSKVTVSSSAFLSQTPETVRQYDLTYRTEGVFDYLETISEKGCSGGKCISKPKVTYDYSPAVQQTSILPFDQVGKLAAPGTFSGIGNIVTPLDVNADGFGDVFEAGITSGGWRVLSTAHAIKRDSWNATSANVPNVFFGFFDPYQSDVYDDPKRTSTLFGNWLADGNTYAFSGVTYTSARTIPLELYAWDGSASWVSTGRVDPKVPATAWTSETPGAFDFDGDGLTELVAWGPKVWGLNDNECPKAYGADATKGGAMPLRPQKFRFWRSKKRVDGQLDFLTRLSPELVHPGTPVDFAFSTANRPPTPQCDRTLSKESGLNWFVDWNGDGLPDFITIWKPALNWSGYGSNQLYGTTEDVGYFVAEGDGNGGFSSGTSPIGVRRSAAGTTPATTDTWSGHSESNFVPMLGWEGHTSLVAGGIPGKREVRFADLNGDRLADALVIFKDQVIVHLNDGSGNFSSRAPIEIALPPYTPANVPDGATDASRFVHLMDVDANGTLEMVIQTDTGPQYIQLFPGDRPGLLREVRSELGARTTATYATIPQLGLDARFKDHRPWSTTSPGPTPVVTSITTTNSMPAPFNGTTTQRFEYADPAYNPWTQQFAGFRRVKRTTVGANGVAVRTKETTFHHSPCEVALGGCDANTRADDAEAVLSGLPITSETYDASGVYLSVKTTGYDRARTYQGLDGRFVRQARVVEQRTRLCDTSNFKPTKATVDVPDVFDSNAVGIDQLRAHTEAVPMRCEIAETLRHRYKYDWAGNTSFHADDGRIASNGAPIDVASLSLTAWVTASLPGSWNWRALVEGVPVSENGSGLTQPWLRLATHAYDPYGNRTSTTAWLDGTAELQRSHELGYAIAPPPVGYQLGGARNVVVSEQTYDAFGNVIRKTGPNGQCTSFAYDTLFQHLPRTTTTFAGGCDQDGRAVTFWYDRGKELVTMMEDASGNLTQRDYDGLGRLTAVTEPNRIIQQAFAPKALIKFDYLDFPATGVQRTHVSVRDSSPDGIHESWSYNDSLGTPLLSFEEADDVAKDGTKWTLGGVAARDTLGQALKTFAPVSFKNGDPSVFPPASALPTKDDLGAVAYDSFGRVISQSLPNASGVVSQTFYHALSVDTYDGNDIRASAARATPHPTTTVSDGHGRVIASVASLENGATLTTKTTYSPTGEPVLVEQIPSSGTPYSRRMVYDTFGRMVENFEPNSSYTVTIRPPTIPPKKPPTGGRGRLPGDPNEPDLPPVVPSQPRPPIVYNYDWRYAYDDSSRLIGTSDARGCGKNIHYDRLSRKIGEDFSPCRAEHADYTSADPATETGFEILVHYDTADAAYTAATGLSSGALLGRVVSVSDLASQTVYSYTGHGEVAGVARRVAKVSTTKLPTSARYTDTWMKRSFTYDTAYRITRATTGADVPELQNTAGESFVERTYTNSGAGGTVGSSYGTLISEQLSDVQGRPTSMTLSDAGGTTATALYKTDRRLDQLMWRRTTPTPRTAPDSLTPRELQHDVFSWDWAGNISQIEDQRSASEWPLGAQPYTRRTFSYDAQNRVTAVDTKRPAPDRARLSRSLAGDAYPSAMSEASEPLRSSQQTYTYDALGSLTSSTDERNVFFDRSFAGLVSAPTPSKPHQLATVGDRIRLTYDRTGNVETLDVARSACTQPEGLCSLHLEYEWDEVGQLMRARRWDLPAAPQLASTTLSSDPNADVSYVYNADGERVFKVMKDAVASLYTIDVFPTLRLRKTRWNDGQKDYEHTRQAEVIDLEGMGKVLFLEPPSDPTSPARGQRVLFSLTDHLGSASAIIDKATGELVEAIAHGPYGTSDTDYRSPRWSGLREDYRFTGKEEDTEVGLVYFGARYYSPQLGRWLSPDPLAVHSLGADLNPYAYVGGRVATHVDPLGLEGTPPPDVAVPTETAGGGILLPYDRITGFSGRSSTGGGENIGTLGPNQCGANKCHSQHLPLGPGVGSNDPFTDGYGRGVRDFVLVDLPFSVATFIDQAMMYNWQRGGDYMVVTPNYDRLATLAEKLRVGPPDDPKGRAGYSLGNRMAAVTTIAAPTRGVGLFAETKGVAVALTAEQVLSQLTAKYRGEFVMTPKSAAEFLSSSEQVAGPHLNRANFGKALERAVGRDIQKNYTHMLEWTGPKGGPDFVGVGTEAGATFDITTFKQQAAHYARPYGDSVQLILYDSAPKGWP